MNLELFVIFKGKVQGVFFRYTVKKHANRYNLKGFAKNLPDGTVEVRVVGKKSDLQAFFNNILKDPGKGSISDVDVSYYYEINDYKDFLIL